MLYKTHLAFSILLSVILSHFYNLNFLSIVLILLSTFIPDIDIPTSKIGKKFKISSFLANKIFHHRGFFHSLIFITLVYIVLKLIIETSYTLPILIGLSSHIFLDIFTKEGIALFTPFYNKRISGFITTGSLSEKAIFFFLIFLILIFSYNSFF